MIAQAWWIGWGIVVLYPTIRLVYAHEAADPLNDNEDAILLTGLAVTAVLLLAGIIGPLLAGYLVSRRLWVGHWRRCEDVPKCEGDHL